MTANIQNNREHLIDQVQLGNISASDANVQMVRDERVRIIHKLPKSVRDVLNNAVKAGKLGHMKKDGLKPEVYYHPEFEYMAKEIRSKEFYSSVNAIKSVCA